MNNIGGACVRCVRIGPSPQFTLLERILMEFIVSCRLRYAVVPRISVDDNFVAKAFIALVFEVAGINASRGLHLVVWALANMAPEREACCVRHCESQETRYSTKDTESKHATSRHA